MRRSRDGYHQRIDDEFVLDVLDEHLGACGLVDAALAMRAEPAWLQRADALVGERRRWHVDVVDVYVFHEDIVYGEILVAR